MHAQFIDTPEALVAFCARLKGSAWLTLDTEFLRERTFHPQFCLLQVANELHAACIDPLTIRNLDPILDLIYDPGILKVFHAGRQDLEIFFRLRAALPLPLFDTQLAAPLLGYAEQISYANLVAETLGVNLSKAHARTDWSRRPLSSEQIEYALSDVVLLARMYPKMLAELAALGRMDWLEKDFRGLADPALYESAPETAWQRVGGVHKLGGATLSVAQALAAWREMVARQEDLPRGWVLKDDALIDLARLRPKSLDDLGRLRGLGDKFVRQHGAHVCQLVGAATQHKPAPFPPQASLRRPTPEQEAVLDALHAVVRLRASQNRLNPASIAGRRDLEWLLLEPEGGALREGWRYHLVGAELEGLLTGKGYLELTRRTLITRADGGA